MGYAKSESPGGPGQRITEVRRVLWGVLILNLAVAGAKMLWGFVSGSIAMQADGFHSLFDGTSNVVGLVGMSFAARPADREHPYGHSKYETYASAAIGAMLAVAAYKVAGSAIASLRVGGAPPEVTTVSFAVMLGTMAVNITVTTWERRAGKRLSSEILVADASHTASDILVSLGVIGGLTAVRLGYPLADPIIGMAVALAIAWTALRVLRQAAVTLSDAARLPVAAVRDAVLEVDGVLGCHNIRTRGLESEIYVDLHVQVDSDTSLAVAHAIAETVERHVCARFEGVADVIVHVEPQDSYQADKTRQELDGENV